MSSFTLELNMEPSLINFFSTLNHMVLPWSFKLSFTRPSLKLSSLLMFAPGGTVLYKEEIFLVSDFFPPLVSFPGDSQHFIDRITFHAGILGHSFYDVGNMPKCPADITRILCYIFAHIMLLTYHFPVCSLWGMPWILIVLYIVSSRI